MKILPLKNDEKWWFWGDQLHWVPFRLMVRFQWKNPKRIWFPIQTVLLCWSGILIPIAKMADSITKNRDHHLSANGSTYEHRGTAAVEQAPLRATYPIRCKIRLPLFWVYFVTDLLAGADWRHAHPFWYEMSVIHDMKLKTIFGEEDSRLKGDKFLI